MSEEYLKEFQLPSKGLLYEGALPDGLVQIEPLGTHEEKLFASGKSGGAVMNKIFSACIKCNIDHKQLVVGDRLFLLFQLRSVSYGSSYRFPYKCTECGKRAEKIVNLDELPPLNPPNPEFTGRFEIVLPLLKKTLELRLLTGQDEDKIEQYAKQSAKHTGADNPEYVYRLARRIEKADGVDLAIRESMELAGNLKGIDSLAVRDAIDENSIGPDLEISPECNLCGYENGPMLLPMNNEFFRPRRRRTRARSDIETAILLDDSSAR